VGTDRIIAPLSEGIGLGPPPERHPGHEHIQWFELDLDDEFDDPDEEPVELFPTERHWRIPD
jgi:hypothetical protein